MQEQVSSEQILGEAQKLVQNLDDTILSDLCSEVCATRGNAVNKILGKLNPIEKPSDSDVLQSLPIAMIASGDYIGTIYFLEHCIRNGAFFHSEIINTVIDSIAHEKVQYFQDGDIEAVETISSTLKGLYNIILAHPTYQTIPEIYLSIGAEQEQARDTYKAIDLYNRAMELGSIEAYFYVAGAYESKGNYEMSASIFDTGYQLSGDDRFLQRYIRALCKIGKREEAYTYYLHLKKLSKDSINPFIVYVEAIYSDDDLHEFELLMTDYQREMHMQPIESFAILARDASVYIGNEIERESSIIEQLNLVSQNNWTEEYSVTYTDSIKRRLYLMQVHLITLQDPRYIDFYVSEMRLYTIDGSQQNHNTMRDYFSANFSPYVFASYQQIANDSHSSIEDMELFESVRIHMVQIAAIFSQFSCYETIRDSITPIVDDCLKIEGVSTDDIEVDDQGLDLLKNEFQDHSSLSEGIKKQYMDYIERIDQKYGMFYRRNVQNIVRDEAMIPAILKGEYEIEMKKNGKNHKMARNTVIGNMIAGIDNIDVTLLFLLEKLITSQKLLGEEEGIDELIQKYHLNELLLADAVLFGALLYSHGEYEMSTQFMIDIPGILDVPQVLYLLMEDIANMDEEDDPNDLIKTLNAISLQEYDDETFFAHVRFIAEDIIQLPDSTDEDIGYMLMASANIKIFEKGDMEEALREFEKAGDYGVYQGYTTAGDLLEEDGKFDEAIIFFRKALLLHPSAASTFKLLNLLIVASRFDEAWEYIDSAIHDGYDVSLYISAYYLAQGKNREAFEQLIEIINSDGSLSMGFPSWYMEELSKNNVEILNSSYISPDKLTLKIFASYIHAALASEGEISDPVDYIKHLGYIADVMDECTSSDMENIFMRTLPILTGPIEYEDDETTTEQIIGYIHLHFGNIQNILQRYHVANVEKKDEKAAKKTFNLINSLVMTAIMIFERFPDSEKYGAIWRNALNLYGNPHDPNSTFYSMPETIQ